MRTLQYFCRFYTWYLFRLNASPAEMAPYQAIKSQFGSIRKALRLGKFVEHIKAAAQAYDAKSASLDPFLRFLAIGRQLGYASYMTFDNIQFLHSSGIRKMEAASAARIQEVAYRSWFVGLACNAIAGVYQLVRLRQRAAAVNMKDGEGVVEAKRIERFVSSCAAVNDQGTDWKQQGTRGGQPPAGVGPVRHHGAQLRAWPCAIPGRRHCGTCGHDELADRRLLHLAEDCLSWWCWLKRSSHALWMARAVEGAGGRSMWSLRRSPRGEGMPVSVVSRIFVIYDDEKQSIPLCLLPCRGAVM